MAKILIVDDEEGVRNVLRRLLEKNSHECSLASDTNQARELLKKQSFDLLISDIKMPGESGLVLAQEAVHGFPDMATIMVTGVDDPDVATDALKAGVYGYLIKPFHQSQVLISVLNALRRKDLERGARVCQEDLEKAVENKTCELKDRLDRLGEAQKALQESEERYRMAIELCNDGVAITSHEKYIYVNRRFVEMHGYDLPEDFIGKPVTAFSHPEDKEWVKSMQARREAGEEGPSVHETRRIRKDGEIIFVDVSASRVVYGGQPCTLAFLRDNTKRKKAEEALRESEERYRKAIELCNDGVAIGSKGKFIYVNRRLVEMHGYDFPEDFIGKSVASFTHPEETELIEALQARREAGEEAPSVYEIRHIKKNGEIIFVDASAARIVYGGQPCTLAFLRDNTKRKKAEEALRESEERFRAITESAQDAIIQIDQEAKLSYWNAAAEKIFGYTKEEAIGKKYYQLLQPEKARNTHELAFEEFKKAGQGASVGRTVEDTSLRKGGEEFPAELSLSSVKIKESWNAVAIVRDISARKKLEKSLEDKTGQLEKTNNQLRKAYKDLHAAQANVVQQEKMASIGQLAAGVAHEINNPTGFISSNLKTLQGYLDDLIGLLGGYRQLVGKSTEAEAGPIPESLTQAIEKVRALESEMDIDFVLKDIPDLLKESREGTERIKKIVVDLKDFAHPGTTELVYADINKNLDSTLNIVWNELKYKAKVTKEYGQLPEVECYPQQLNQVFMNILVNAAHAIEKQGEIKIATKADNGHVAVAISDTGGGIPKENLARIFEPFFTTKEVGKGTGLGLHVAYNIVKKHHGTIEVKSEVGKGTTFIIQLPLKGESLPASA